MGDEIYDVVEKRILSGRNIDIARSLNIDESKISHLRLKTLHVVGGRFILLERKNELVFTLVDFSSKEEFDCVSALTLFIHLNVSRDKRIFLSISKSVSKLKNGVHLTMEMQDRIFCLKGNENKDIVLMHASQRKNSHLKSDVILEYKNKRKRIKEMESLLRRRLLHALDSAKTKKALKTLELLGCSSEYLVRHLESQFKDGMTWNNRGSGDGKWNIDHIIPCNTFDLTIENEQRKCFHYSNLRPLWAHENIRRPFDGCDMFGYGLDI